MRTTRLLCALALAGCGGDGGNPDGGPPADATMPPDIAPTCLAGLPDLAYGFDPKCPVKKPPAPDTLDEALGLAGLDRCTLGFSAEDWSLFPAYIREDAWRLPWYDPVHDYAVRAPAYARDVVAELDAAAASPTPVADALTVAGAQLVTRVPPCIAPSTMAGDQPLADAIARLIMDHGGSPDGAALASATAQVPMDLQRALAQVVLAVDAANLAYLDLLKPLSPDDLDALSRVGALVLPSGYAGPMLSQAAVRDLLAKRFDEGALVDGAVRLAYGIETAHLAQFAGKTGFHVDVPTPIGRIVVGDAKDDSYDDTGDPIALLVDTGGDDTYHAPVGAVDGTLDLHSPRHVGVAIDLAGKDTYAYDVVADKFDTGNRIPSDSDGRYHPPSPFDTYGGPISLSETPRQGGARMGYGMLFDYGGDGDHYQSLRMSQGFGIAGVGVLYDAGGDDLYEGEAGVQGGGAFGVGLLLDAAGDDTYRTWAFAEGFGYVRGVGVLYDAAGKDKYLADVGDPQVGGDPLYLSPQLPCDQPSNMVPIAQRTNCGNSSFTQGAGFGRRAPGAGDNAYMSGGLGVLRDRAGDDVYTTGVFGEGTGYWFGTGVLADGGGNDAYDGKWYVQGSSAHFALALFLDDGGDDKYNQTVTPSATSIGVGHDFSVSWHIDGGGDDVYRAPGLSLGAGNTNGVGVLLNLGGNDQYHAPGEPTLGCGNPSVEVESDPGRWQVPTSGIFVDIGGTDVYDAPSNVVRADDTTWIDEREPPDAGILQHGAGVDRSDGGVALP